MSGIKDLMEAMRKSRSGAYVSEHRKRADLYGVDTRGYLAALLKRRNPNTHTEFDFKYVDLLGMVCRRRASGLFSPGQSPRRTWVNEAGVEAETEQAYVLKQWHKHWRFDTVLEKVAVLGQLHRTVLVAPVWRAGRIKFDILAPHEWNHYASPEDPSAVEASLFVYVSNSRGGGLLWSKENWVRLDKEDEILETGENPYGLMPFLVFHYDEPGKSMWQKGGNDLTDACMAVAYGSTDMHHTARFQSHGQPVFTGMEADEAKKMVLSPSRGIGLGIGQTFQYVASEGKALTVRLDEEAAFLSNLAHTYDLPADTFDDHRQPESGVARRIANSALNQFRTQYAMRLAELEERMFKLCRLIHNTQRGPDQREVPPNINLEVVSTAKTTPLDPVEQLEVDAIQIGLGIKSPVDVIMRDEGCVREVARAIYERNLSENQSPERDALQRDRQLQMEARENLSTSDS